MTPKETIEKAYSHIPKETGNIHFFDWEPSFGLKRIFVRIRRLFRNK